jgi:hypothetical protein
MRLFAMKREINKRAQAIIDARLNRELNWSGAEGETSETASTDVSGEQETVHLKGENSMA